jgi:hypothetical protein
MRLSPPFVPFALTATAKALTLTFFTGCLLLAAAAGASAEPLVITDGVANISNPAGFGIGSFNLLAPGFSATASGIPNSANGIAQIRGGIRSFPNLPFQGAVCTGGTCLNGYFNGATVLNFTLGPFSGPGPDYTNAGFFASVPFTMTGALVLTEPTGFAGAEVLFTTEIAGGGYAGITFTRSFNTYIITNVVYAFGATQPLPEPATMILLATGLAGVAAKVRKRRLG